MDALDHGGLLLWVRTPDAAREEKARAILAKHGGRDVHVHDLKMPRGERGPLTQFFQKSTERV